MAKQEKHCSKRNSPFHFSSIPVQVIFPQKQISFLKQELKEI